jgi:hypothetical protein
MNSNGQQWDSPVCRQEVAMTISEKLLYVVEYVKAHDGRVEFNDSPYMRLIARLDKSKSDEYDLRLVMEYFDSTGQIDYALIVELNEKTGAIAMGQQLWTGNRVPIAVRQFVERFEQMFQNHFLKVWLENL